MYLGPLDTVKKSYLNKAADFHVLCKSVYKIKNKNNEITLCMMAVILQSRCFQMSDGVPNFSVSIDASLINIKTVL